LLSIKRIKTILLKDLKDVIRDSRILVAILTPLLIGVLYNFTFQDDTTPTATIAVAGDDSELPSQLQQAAGAAVNIHIQTESDEAAVRSVVIDKQDADIGLIIPNGFDEAIQAGQSPELTVILPADPTLAGSLIAGLIDPVLRSEAGANPGRFRRTKSSRSRSDRCRWVALLGCRWIAGACSRYDGDVRCANGAGGGIGKENA
jgi:hypothetical protein